MDFFHIYMFKVFDIDLIVYDFYYIYVHCTLYMYVLYFRHLMIDYILRFEIFFSCFTVNINKCERGR